jgi:hypothetical protein
MSTKTHYIDGDNYQLRQIIFANTPKAIQQCKSIAPKFKGATEMDTCRNIFDFLKNDVKYVADGSHQKVKLPSALLRERVGDCKSYSLFTGAILSNLGIPWKYVLVSYREDPTPTHIYVVTDSGIIIDAVWGTFNSEKTPTHKYYHKPDMRISTITGIGGNAPNKVPTTTSESVPSLIGYRSPMGNVKAIDSQAPIGAPRAFIWFRTMKGRDASAGEQAEWGTKKVLNAAGREIVLQLFKNNAGGMATMLYDLVFKKEPTVYPIPEAVSKALSDRINAYILQVGYKQPTDSQFQKIIEIQKAILKSKYANTGGAKIATGGGTLPSNFSLNVGQEFELLQTLLTDSEKENAYNRVMGSGQYQANKKVTAFINTEVAKTKSQYTVTPSKKASEQYGAFENKWFWMGGDPWDVNDAIQEGAKKSPRGKLFNYVIGITQTRGLKAKDFPLLIRAIVDVTTGDKFSLSDSGSYVMGKGVGIGEPVTFATVTANIKLIGEIIASLIGLFLLFKSAFGGEGSDEEGYNEEQAKLEWYLTNGYMAKSDAIEFKAPTPYLDEVTVNSQTVVKVDPDWLKKKFGGDGLTAGFGNLVIPLLIGVGAIIALNTAGKQK